MRLHIHTKDGAQYEGEATVQLVNPTVIKTDGSTSEVDGTVSFPHHLISRIEHVADELASDTLDLLGLKPAADQPPVQPTGTPEQPAPEQQADTGSQEAVQASEAPTTPVDQATEVPASPEAAQSV